MAKQITEELKNLFAAQGVTATGDTIAEVLKSGYEQLNDATVSGNLIADIIAQCAETGTFPGGGGGGAAPTVVDEITWDGNTEGLESHTLTIPEQGAITLYKVSDAVLPCGIMDGGDFYEYTTVAQDDDTTTGVKWGAFAGDVLVGSHVGTFDVVSAYCNNAELPSSLGGGVIAPSTGTWFVKDGTNYIKSVTATLVVGE